MMVADLLRDSPFATIQVDGEGKLVAWNDDAAALLRVPADAAGRAVADVLPAGDPGWSALLAAGRAADRTWRMRLGEDEEAYVAWRVHPIGDGGALCYATDVSERQRAMRRAEIESTALRAILESLTIAVWVVDPQGVYLYQEGKALAGLGLVGGQMVGFNVFDLFRGLPELEVLRAGLTGEAAHYAVAGANTDWDNWQVPIFDDAGEVSALVGISLDVTELKRTARDLQGKLDLIERQQRAIRELSTPIIEVWDRILTLPIVGLVDSTRTAEIMENLLEAVVRYRARYAILDLTGVEVVDTSTASHILGLIRTIRLLGAEGILTGIHPSIAQTIVTLGVDLSGLIVRSTLREALQHCIIQMAKKARPAAG